MKPKCSYFGSCGGCAYQDLPYEEQLELKRDLVRENLSRFNRAHTFEIFPTVPSPMVYGYRHMISMTVKRRNGELKLGFIGWRQDEERMRRTFVPVDACSIADRRLNLAIPEAMEKLHSLPPKKRFRTSQIVLRIGDDGVDLGLLQHKFGE